MTGAVTPAADGVDRRPYRPGPRRMTATYIIGDARAVIATLPDNSVDLLITSPPFLALRSYLAPDHPDKAFEMGSEPTPGAFIDGLLDVVELADRVLAPHASICIELGDTYAGSGGRGGDYLPGGLREDQPGFGGSAEKAREGNAAHWRQKNQKPRFDGSASSAYGTGAAPRPARGQWRSPGPDPKYKQRGEQARGTGAGGDWPQAKSLCLIPELFRIALVYGFNPLTGRCTPRWRVRNVIRWCRPNPPVGALADKVRPATSDMVVACKSRARYFDLDAVRTSPVHGFAWAPGSTSGHASDVCPVNGGDASHDNHTHSTNPAGAPPLDHWWHNEDTFDQDAWKISTRAYKGSHYATWPEKLLDIPIETMCPRRVCRTCGEPSRRITETSADIETNGDYLAARAAARHGERLGMGSTGRQHIEPRRVVPTGGWTDCGHDNWRPGVVFDPFAGSGTTALVATGHGRDFVGCDLDARNADLARERVGMFLTVETLGTPAARADGDTAVGDAP